VANETHSFNNPCVLFTFVVIDEKWEEMTYWIKYAESKAKDTNGNSIFVRVMLQTANDNIPPEIANNTILTTYVTNNSTAYDLTGMRYNSDNKKELINEKELLGDIDNVIHNLN